MDNITAMRTVEVRPDQRELTSAKDTKDDNKKDTYTRLIEGMPILIVVACVALVWAVIIMSTKADTENTLKGTLLVTGQLGEQPELLHQGIPLSFKGASRHSLQEQKENKGEVIELQRLTILTGLAPRAFVSRALAYAAAGERASLLLRSP
jgi:hypothetical protein